MNARTSRFVRNTLLPDEHCIKDARFPVTYSFSAFVVFAFCVMLGYAVREAGMRYFGAAPMTPVYAGAGIGAWMLFWMLLKRSTTEIILTNKRLIYKRGFFLVKIDEVDIEQLASDNVVQTFFGRIFDYGAVHVRCIEATDIWLPAITQPYEFRNALEEQKHHYREEYMSVGRLRKQGEHPTE